MTRSIVDLTHPITHGMETYPGLPGPVISDHMSRVDSRPRYAPDTEFHIARIEMVANTGTYVDTPFHRYAQGPDLSGVDLARLADVEGVLIDASAAGREIGPAQLKAAPAVRGQAVLVRTGWDRHWGTPQYGDASHPFLTADAVAWLIEQGAAVVGIDSVNIDDMADLVRPAHTGLLAAGIPIIEHLCGLDRLPERGFRFHAAPPPVVGLGSFPIRAYAVVE